MFACMQSLDIKHKQGQTVINIEQVYTSSENSVRREIAGETGYSEIVLGNASNSGLTLNDESEKY